jgi:hypothetical protein
MFPIEQLSTSPGDLTYVIVDTVVGMSIRELVEYVANATGYRGKIQLCSSIPEVTLKNSWT